MLNYLPIIPIARAVAQFIIPDLSIIVGEYARSSDYEVFYAINWNCRLNEYIRVMRHGSRLRAVDPNDEKHVQKYQVICTIGKQFIRCGYISYKVWISADLDSDYIKFDSINFNIFDLYKAIVHKTVHNPNQEPILIFSDILSARFHAAILDYE